MRKTASLAERSFIVDLLEAGSELSRKLHGADDETAPFRPPHVLARLLRQAFPPLIEIGGVRAGNVIPLKMEGVFWLGLRKGLRKGEQIRPGCGFFQRGQKGAGIIQRRLFKPDLIMDPADAQPPAIT